jgi:hypothetical protein
MVKSNVRSVHKEFELPELLVLHLRWMVVLAKLKEVDRNDAIAALEFRVTNGKIKLKEKKKLIHLIEQRKVTRNVAELVDELKIEVLFAKAQSIFLDTSSDGFGQWFGIKEESKSGAKSEGPIRGVSKFSPFNTIYQCRNFYALDAPNNLVQRLSKMLEASLSESGFDASSDKGSKHDSYIRQWGKYAFELVQENGGWNKFSLASSLSEIKDIWVGNHAPENNSRAAKADHYNSLIKRILHLERDQYIQILTSTVATLWLLWFLKSNEHNQLLRTISEQFQNDKNLYLGKPLPDDDLFIDINTYVGSMDGLPYPFGAADYFLSRQQGVSGNINYQFGDPWPSSSQLQIANELRDESWCPPLLFAVRGDQSSFSTDPSKNAVIPFVQISEKCTSFSRIYFREKVLSTKPTADGKSNSEWKQDFDLWFQALQFGVEEGTYGDGIVEKLQKDGLTRKPKTLSRLEMARGFEDNEDVDIVFLFPPVDTLIQLSENYKRIYGDEVYEVFNDKSKYMPQYFPSCVLCTGNFARSQPRMRELLTDLCAYLGSTYYLFHYLSPKFSSLTEKFDLFHVGDIRRKKKASGQISDFCKIVQEEKLIGNIIDSKFVETAFKKIGEEMGLALFREDNLMRVKFIKSWDEWAWVELLEMLKDISIFITYDFS